MRKSKLLLPINFFHTQPFYKKRCAQSKITSEKKRDGQKKTCELRSLRRTYIRKDTIKYTKRKERDKKRDKQRYSETDKEKRKR